MRQSIAALYQEYNAADDAQDAPISGLFEVDDEGFALIYGEGISLEFGYEGIQIYNGQGLGNSRALYSQNTAPDGFVMSYVTAENITRLDKSISLEDIPQITIRRKGKAAVRQLDRKAEYSLYDALFNNKRIRRCRWNKSSQMLLCAAVYPRF